MPWGLSLRCGDSALLRAMMGVAYNGGCGYAAVSPATAHVGVHLRRWKVYEVGRLAGHAC